MVHVLSNVNKISINKDFNRGFQGFSMANLETGYTRHRVEAQKLSF